MAGVLAIDGGYNWRTAPVRVIRKRPRIPIHHAALWFGGSLVRGFVRKHPYLSAAAAAAALGLGAYRYSRRRPVRKMATTPRYPVAKRRRFDGGDAVGDAGAPYVNDVHYKRKRTLGKINVRKLAREGVAALYDRFQMINNYGATTFNYVMAKEAQALAQSGATLTNYQTYPVFLFDVSSARNYVNGTETVPYMAWQLTRLTTDGTFGWNYLKGQNVATGAVGTTQGECSWQYIQTPKTSAGAEAPIDRCLLDWVKVQMYVGGSKKCTHKVFVDLVQLDPLDQPQYNSAAPSDGLSSSLSTFAVDEKGNRHDANDRMTSMVARLCDGPFSTWTAPNAGRPTTEKILDRKVLEFSPVASFEENGAALIHKKSLNAYYKLGRKVRYDWRQDTSNYLNVLGNNTIETDIERGAHDVVAHPKARVYLRVMAQVFNKAGDNSFTEADCSPTFDIRITRKMLVSS